MSDDPVLEAFRRAAEDRDRGAAEIERALLTDLLSLRPLWTPEGLAAGAGALSARHSAMAPLIGLADRIRGGDMGDLQRFIEQRMSALRSAPQALAAGALPWIEQCGLVVSISRSSAVAAAIRGAWRAGWSGRVVVLDGSSAGRGAAQAEGLCRHGRAVSQPDAAAPRWLDESDPLVVVGADAVAPSRFINCIGSLGLLELAAAREVPTILIADRGKNVSEGALDEMVANSPLHRDDAGREWTLFEAVPRALVAARISD